MKDFLGIVRDTLPIDNPVGTWQYGRNMVSNKKNKTVSNEDGFSFEYLVPGTIIGVIVTTSDIVYFSINNDGSNEIGVVHTEVDTPIYETKIKSNLFNFQYNCPIEGVFIYNFKKELIVAWADGIKDNSNKPYVINLDNPPIELNNDKTLVNNNEFTKLLMFPNVKEAQLTLDKIKGSSLYPNVIGAYITYAYAYDEDDILPFFSISNFTFLNELFETYYTPSVYFTGLDLNFNKLQIGIVLKLKDSTLIAYKSFLINYTTNTLRIYISSLNNYTKTVVDDIVIGKVNFDKIETLTKQNNQINVGNVKFKKKLDFQKYANLIKLKPIIRIAGDSKVFSDASLMPDEVYSFYIELQLLDGTYTDAYHIPGRVAENTELNKVTSTQINTYGLPTGLQNLEQFKVINTGIIDTKFGYWENKETYPNTKEYNSFDLNGEDLRNTPIRYHRVPSKENLPYNYGEYGNDLLSGGNFKIGVQVINFNTIVPDEIKNQIQGYRLSFVKRTLNNSLVSINCIATHRYEKTRITNGVVGELNAPLVYNISSINSDSRWKELALYSNELIINKPNISVNYLKINYFRNAGSILTEGRPVQVKDNIKYLNIDTLKYLPNNNFKEGTSFREELITTSIKDDVLLNNNIIDGVTVDNGFFDVTLINDVESVYQGFKSSDLVILEKTNDLNNFIDFYGGDVYVNEFELIIHQIFKNSNDNKYGFLRRFLSSILYSPYNNVNFEINNPPDSNFSFRFDTLDYFYGLVPEDSVLKSATSDLIITGSTITTINDIVTILTNNFLSNSINDFPYRIYRSLKISNESISIKSFRSFLINSYYEMPNDKGEIIALRGTDKKLFIQLKYALFIATIKDTLDTGVTKTFLGQSDIFEYIPKEILVDEKGTIGSTSKFACVFIKDMYITVNQNTGQIFIVNEGLQEISKQGNMQWFRNNWTVSKSIDNPYISYGHIIGYDKEYNRLLFVKKDYEFIQPAYATFDGNFYIDNFSGNKLEFTDKLQIVGNPNIDEPDYRVCFKNKSKTLSYSLDKKMFQFEHDYFPSIIFNNHVNLFSLVNKLNPTNGIKIYKHNNKLKKGVYYDEKFESYIDVIFNQNLEITKLYQSLHWITTVINSFNVVEPFKTVSKIILYNDNQCSGEIDLKPFDIKDIKTRNNDWFLNNFRDLVKDMSLPIIDENGEIIKTNINNLKVWFEKSNFISKFIVARLIIDNKNNNDIYLHQVNVKSIISK